MEIGEVDLARVCFQYSEKKKEQNCPTHCFRPYNPIPNPDPIPTHTTLSGEKVRRFFFLLLKILVDREKEKSSRNNTDILLFSYFVLD